jgi:hypothetical protein
MQQAQSKRVPTIDTDDMIATFCEYVNPVTVSDWAEYS